MVSSGEVRDDGPLGALFAPRGRVERAADALHRRVGAILFQDPESEYGQLAGVFNPILFDADEWVRLAVESGMQYLVVTSKHHDGFAMFRSRVDPYNIYDASPFRRDVIGELAEACDKHGLKLGLYYSQDLDWHEPNGGGYRHGHTNCGVMSWTNDWDYPDNAAKNYTQCFESKIKPQVEEIVRNYGELCLIWFDTPLTLSPEQSTELVRLVKTLSARLSVEFAHRKRGGRLSLVGR